MKYYLLILFSLLSVNRVLGQEMIPDTTAVKYRSFDEEAIDELRSQSKYNYEMEPRYEENPIRRLWYNFLKRLRQSLGPRTVSVFTEIFKYTLIIIGLYVLLRYLLTSTRSTVFKKDDKSPDFHGKIIHSESGDQNLLKLIKEAEIEEDYELAISYHFLMVLRSLHQAKQIEWRDFKTNEDYLMELKDSTLKESFAELSMLFEVIVYGDYSIDLESYQESKSRFSAFLAQLKSGVA